MNTVTLQITRPNVFRLIYNMQRLLRIYVPNTSCTTTIDSMDVFTSELLQRHKTRLQNSRNTFQVNELGIRYFMESENTDIPKSLSSFSPEKLDNIFTDLLSKNKDKQIKELISECTQSNKLASEYILKNLLRSYSMQGKVDMVKSILSHCEILNPELYYRNGEFQHYLAKAQCLKGNSEKGLSILTECYLKYEPLRSLYRLIFKELIQDSVLNRSEASMVIFKKNVLEFSDRWNDHYPLICMWNICWMSTWFSDQMLAVELFDTSRILRNIIKDKATAFSMTALKTEYNEDAVVRLLQSLLKYELINEYVKVLQVLFSYKLRNRDLRGCTEIVKNCEVLGVSLTAEQQGRYIRMLIDGKYSTSSTAKPQAKNFKLKF